MSLGMKERNSSHFEKLKSDQMEFHGLKFYDFVWNCLDCFFTSYKYVMYLLVLDLKLNI